MKVVVFDKETGETSKPAELMFSEVVEFKNENLVTLKNCMLNVRYEFRPVLEGVEVYVTRDKGNKFESKIFLYLEKPRVIEQSDGGIDYWGISTHLDVTMDANLFPSIQPGQCVKAKIVLEEE